MLTNISKTKGSQTLKFGQLIEYNLRKIFLESHTQNAVEILFPPRPLSKKSKLSMSLDQ